MKYCIHCGSFISREQEFEEKDTCSCCEESGVVEMVKIHTIGNYYGTPAFVKFDDGTYSFELADHSENRSTPISQEFFAACVKEFRSK